MLDPFRRSVRPEYIQKRFETYEITTFWIRPSVNRCKCTKSVVFISISAPRDPRKWVPIVPMHKNSINCPSVFFITMRIPLPATVAHKLPPAPIQTQKSSRCPAPGKGSWSRPGPSSPFRNTHSPILSDFSPKWDLRSTHTRLPL